MIVGLLVMMGISIVGGIILAIVNIVSGGKVLGENHLNEYGSDENDTTGFFDDSRKSSRNDYRPYSDPFDNHWETSFDWKDEDNDGYDDRDDGFWNEREF